MRRWPKEKVNTHRIKEEILQMLSLDFELGGFLVQEMHHAVHFQHQESMIGCRKFLQDMNG